MPPTPAVFDQRMIDVGPIGQTHISKEAARPIAAVRLEENFFPKHHRGRRLLGLVAVWLTLLGAVDATQTDAFGVLLSIGLHANRFVLPQSLQVLQRETLVRWFG
jgi:hypothetical protein